MFVIFSKYLLTFIIIIIIFQDV